MRTVMMKASALDPRQVATVGSRATLRSSRPQRPLQRFLCRAATGSNDSASPSGGVATATAISPSAALQFSGSIDAQVGHTLRNFLFDEEQLEVIKHLRESISNCAMAFSAVAGTNILLSSVQALGFAEEAEKGPAVAFGNFTVGDVAYWGDSAMLVGLFLFALGPLDSVLNSKANQMPRLFQGLDRLGLIFQQLSIGSLAVSTVTALEAAVKYPPIVVFFSEVFFALAGMSQCRYVLSKRGSDSEQVGETLGVVRGCAEYAKSLNPLERVAVSLAFGYLVQHEEKQPHQPVEGEDEYYEFTLAEERVLKGVTESVNTAGLALGLQAFTTLMLTVADWGNEDWSGVVSNGINSANKILCAALVFQASESFDRALHTVGSDDVKHLLDGLGEEGLTNLFEKLSVLAWAVSLAAVVGIGAPWLEENFVLTALSDAASHHTAEVVIEGLETAVKILRGI